MKIINEHFNTQDKIDLDKFHIEAFGYGCNVDPTKYNGYVFRKGRNHKYKWLNIPNYSDFTNDIHSVNEMCRPLKEKRPNSLRYMIVKCPLREYDDKSVYQKYIDGKKGKYYKEYRLSIINSKIFCVLEFLKTKIERNCTTSTEQKITVFKTKDFFKEREKMYKCIIKYLTLVGLEYGDIDMLEDINGNLYMIDINNAPMGDPYSNNYYRTIWNEYISQIKILLHL